MTSAHTESMAWLLAFDASTPRCVAVIGRIAPNGGANELVAWDDDRDHPNQASARLVGRLHALVESAGRQFSELTAIGCGCGPGTFTGTRVAVATAKGLALGLDRPILPLSTLAAIAMSYTPAPGDSTIEFPLLAMLDARRGEVYAGLFQATIDPPSLAPLSEERVAPCRDVVTALEGYASVIPIGTGVEPYRSDLPSTWQALAQPIPGPTPVGLWRSCVGAFRAQNHLSAGAVEAVYLRRSYAELGINKPKRAMFKSPFI